MRKTTAKNLRLGFTTVELLIALALTAMILVGLVTLFNASAHNYAQNESIYKTINSTRQALNRIASQVRTATVVNPNSPSNECALITHAGQDITYRFDSPAKALYLVDTSGSHLLCENVVDAAFTRTFTDDGLTVTSVKTAITVSDGTTQRTVVGAAAVRRKLK